MPQTELTAALLLVLQNEERKIINNLQQLFLRGEMDEYRQDNDRLAEIRKDIDDNLLRCFNVL